MNKNNAIVWLRVSFWIGAVFDLLDGLAMLFPGLLGVDKVLSIFSPTPASRFAFGMGAPVMLGWTVLLLWADRKPLERKDVLPITVLVVLGEVANEIVAARAGSIPTATLVPTWILQAAVGGLFIFSYLNARRSEGK
jgi:hypothetical protein